MEAVPGHVEVNFTILSRAGAIVHGYLRGVDDCVKGHSYVYGRILIWVFVVSSRVQFPYVSKIRETTLIIGPLDIGLFTGVG